MSAVDLPAALPPAPPTRRVAIRDGRVFGAIVLAAFVLYGVGSATAHRPVGLALVVANSLAVSCAGLIGFRLVRRSDRGVALGYGVSRVAEAVLLLSGIVLARHGDVGDADVTGYLLAMSVLGAGSVPFCAVVGRRRLIPRRLAAWGVVGYAALAAGALGELTTGRAVAVVLAVPGGLFELALGLYLVRYGFRSAEQRVSESTLVGKGP